MFNFLQDFSDYLVYKLLKMPAGEHLTVSVNFFIYDSLKILILLLIINFLMAAFRYYIPTQKIRDFLIKRKWYGLDYFLASAFGVLTPFCSCSSIPLFVGFLSAGIPLGVTLSFLITSPLVNEASIAIFAGSFGFKITAVYVLSGIIVGMLGGFVIGKLKMEGEVDDVIKTSIKNLKSGGFQTTQEKHELKDLIGLFWREGWDLTKKIYVYVLIGVGVGSVIHGYVPSGFFENYLQNAGFWSVPLAAILAVPLYSNAVGVIPIMQALVAKGVPFGTALAFMMATVGLSLPEAMILKRAMKRKLLVSFFTVVTIGIILIGFLVNLAFS
jgi:uncharacterized protein